MKINLDPNTYSYTKARFDIEYGGKPSGYTVNIGDSHSNNGHNGDGGDQSNDAEMMVLGTKMSVYPNDAGGSSPLLEKENIVTQGTTLSLEVSDNRLAWDNHSGEADQLDSPYLYALNGQPDSEGPVNYDIYAGFNRTIGTASRNGSGVTKVTITLSASPSPDDVEISKFQTAGSTVRLGEMFSYYIPIMNRFQSAVDLMVTDALSAFVDYVAGSLEIYEGGTQMAVNESVVMAGGNLNYSTSTVDYEEPLLIKFDVRVKDIVAMESIIYNQAFVTVSHAGIPILSKGSNIVQTRVVPEPATMFLIGSGLFVLVGLRRKLKK